MKGWLLVAAFALGLAGFGGYYAWPKVSRAFDALTRQMRPPAASVQQAAAPLPNLPPRAFPQTGYEVGGQFLGLWDQAGGVPVFGYPISPRMTEVVENGQKLTVQYFERARLEMHPEYAGTQFEVLLGRLGALVPLNATVANPLPEGLRGEQVYFKETGISTPRRFFTFWEHSGGLMIFGYPITPVLMDKAPDGRPLTVQYFERTRFEYHEEYAGTSSEVELTHLGTQIYQSKHEGKP